MVLGPERVVRLMLYALPDGEYEMMLRSRVGEEVRDGALLSDPGLGRGTVKNDSLS